jgi:ferredoxin
LLKKSNHDIIGNIKEDETMPAKVDKDTCIGCGACAGVCPVGAIALQDDGKAGVDEGTCIDCGACVSTCPVSAISQ